MVTGDRSLSSSLLMELRSARPHSMRRIIFRVARPDTLGWARSSVGFCSRSANSLDRQFTKRRPRPSKNHGVPHLQLESALKLHSYR